VDVWFTTNSVAERVKSDAQLFKTLDYDKLPAAKAIEPGARNNGWVGMYFYPLGIVWRPDMLAQPITSWKELWEPRFAQKLCVPSMNMFQARTLLVAASIHGGGINNVEPGFEALKRLKPNVVAWYTSDNTARQGLAQGEYPVLIAPPAALKRMIDSKVSARMISPRPAPMMYDVMMLVNTAKADMSLAFIDFCLGQEAQEIVAQGQGMAPVHPGAKPLAELAESVPASEDRVTFDDSIINANIAGWNERFNREIAT
jgi:spermidine/putrescine-binding protein